MIKAVIFDIDGTLTSDVSWTTLTKAMGADVEIHNEIFKSFKEDKSTLECAKKQLLELWKNTNKSNRQFITELVENWPIYPEAFPLMKYFESKAIKMCIITGSFDLYAKAIAHRLNIPSYYANTTFIWDGQNNLVDFDYHLDQAQVKLDHFNDYCKTQKILPSECIVIGDSDNDLKLFKESGYGIAVASPTSHYLAGTAWRKVNNLGEIKDIVESL